MTETLAAKTAPTAAKPRTLVVFHDKPQLYMPSVEIGSKTCSGVERVDLNKIVLVPMDAGISISANSKRIAEAGYVHLDAHVLEAFLESDFVIPESFAGKNIFFCGEPDIEPQINPRHAMYMAENGNGWTAWFAGMSQEVPEGTFAACVEKKEILSPPDFC